jgi:crossover junction endodeoxyribonuclease RuvC
LLLLFLLPYFYPVKVVKDKIILGIDPGTSEMGYGLIAIKGKQVSMITMGIIHLSKISDHHLKLQRIFNRVVSLIDEFHPDELAIEAPFFGKNVQSMLKLGRAQGVAIAAALSRELPIAEYAPKKIKQSITGNGNASKEQVAKMLQQLLAIKELPKYLDATDGLAAALCHYYQSNMPVLSGAKGWDSFLTENPHRNATPAKKPKR